MKKLKLEVKKQIYQEYSDDVSIQGLSRKYNINFSNLRYMLKLIEIYSWNSYIESKEYPIGLKKELINKVLNKEDLVDTQQLNYFSYVMVHHGMLIMLEISKSIVLI